MKSNFERVEINHQTTSKQVTSSFVDVFVSMSFWSTFESMYKADFYITYFNINNPAQFADTFDFIDLANSFNVKNKDRAIECAPTDKEVVDLVKDKQGKYHMMLIIKVRVPKNNIIDGYLKNTSINSENIISVRAMKNEEHTVVTQTYKRPNPDVIWPNQLVIENTNFKLANKSLKTLDQAINAIQHATAKEKARALYDMLEHDLYVNNNSELVLSIISQTTQLLKMRGNYIDFNQAIQQYLETANKLEGSPSIAWALVGTAMSALGAALIAIGTLVCVGTLGLGIPIGAAMIAGGSVLTVASGASFFNSRRTGLSAQMMELVDNKTSTNDMDVDVEETAPIKPSTPVKTRQSVTTPSVIIRMPTF